MIFDANHIIQSGGLLAIGLIIFAECGLLIGLFFPGDTLLFAAGFFAAQGKLPIIWLLIVVVISAIIGYQIGYRIGEKLGPQMFKRDEGILFRREYINKTKVFFERYGKATIVFARFIAHVRTFMPLIAGAGKMDRRSYLIYNALGALLWGVSLTMIGYGLGATVPNIDRYLLPIIFGLLIIIYAVVFWEILKDPKRRGDIWSGLKSDMRYLLGRKNKKTS